MVLETNSQRLGRIDKADFLTNGVIKKQMSAACRNWREAHGMGYLNGRNGNNGNNGQANGIPQPTTYYSKK